MEGIDETTGIEELVAHDLNFHRVIGQAAGNEYLGSLAEALSGGTVRARIWRGLTQDHAVARTLLTVHVSGVEAWLREAM